MAYIEDVCVYLVAICIPPSVHTHTHTHTHIHRIMTFHGLPFAWFVAQFLKYLMRPSPQLKDYLATHGQTIGLNMTAGPIVG